MRRLVLPILLVTAVLAAVPMLERGPALLDCDTPGADGVVTCLHGSEDPPPGVDARRRPSVDDLRRRGEEMRERARGREHLAASTGGTLTAATGDAVACIGDGTTGTRVQAIYARAADVPDRFGTVAPYLRQFAAGADLSIDQSARATGGGRRVRFATDADCRLDIRRVTLSTTGDDTVRNTIAELEALGYDRSDRKYLVWVDAAVGICGVAQLRLDDRPTLDNGNNRGRMFGRVDAPCWGYAETHELLHTLGAIQGSAPNATDAGHCTDEYDVMCYQDSPTTVLSVVCPDAPGTFVDCNADDYLHVAPPPGSYLAQHWNVANSAWLEPVALVPTSSWSPLTVVMGPDTFVRATLSMADTGLPAAGVEVSLEGRSGTASWTPLATTLSDAQGTVRFTYRPTARTEVRVRSSDSSSLAGAISEAVQVSP